MTSDIPTRQFFWIVPKPPRTVEEHFPWQLLDGRVKYNAIAANACEWGLSVEFRKHMVVRVVAVKTHKNARIL